MRELPKPRPTFVLARGAYDAPTERVTPGTPRAIGDFPANLPQNRLGLARWLLNRAPSADRARDRQPLLGDVLRARARRHAGGFRQSGPAALSPAAAGLAGDDVRRFGVEPEGACRSASCCRPPIGRTRGSTRSGSSRIRQTSGSRADRRIGWPPSRFATARSRPAGSWSAPSAGRASTRTSRPASGKRSRRGMRPSTSRGTGRISIAAAFTPSGSGRRRRRPPSASTRPSGCSARSTASARIHRCSRWCC